MRDEERYGANAADNCQHGKVIDNCDHTDASVTAACRECAMDMLYGPPTANWPDAAGFYWAWHQSDPQWTPCEIGQDGDMYEFGSEPMAASRDCNDGLWRFRKLPTPPTTGER